MTSQSKHDSSEDSGKKETAPIGGYVLASAPIEINEGRPTVTLNVRNTGDRPIQVGSHFHFFEVNRALEFDREATFGMRLDIPSGTAVRFEPGDQKSITLVPVGGERRIYGFNNLVDGSAGNTASPEYRKKLGDALKRVAERGFKSKK